MDKSKWGGHISHCCSIHGCKYGYADCPVVTGLVLSANTCEDCWDMLSEYESYTVFFDTGEKVSTVSLLEAKDLIFNNRGKVSSVDAHCTHTIFNKED